MGEKKIGGGGWRRQMNLGRVSEEMIIIETCMKFSKRENKI